MMESALKNEHATYPQKALAKHAGGYLLQHLSKLMGKSSAKAGPKPLCSR